MLQREESSNTLIYFVTAILVFLLVSFTVITASFFPIVIFLMIAIISWIALKNQLTKLITFTRNHLIVDYKIGFITWQRRHENVLAMDWFVNVYEKPTKIKIGYKDRILLRFTLDDLETLPKLTQNVTELMSMEVDMNETIGKWENIRLRSPQQLPNYQQFHNITIEKDKLKLKILTFGIRRFEVNLQLGILKYSKWLTTKTVDLKNVKAIYYYFGSSNFVDNTFMNWAYVDKQTGEPIPFFKFRRTGDEYEETHYPQLNFKIDNRNLVRLLQNLSAFDGIEIKEQKF